MKRCLLLLIVPLQLSTGRTSSADGSAIIGCERVVRAAVEHSAALGIADWEFRALNARRAQVIAQGLPSLDVEVRAARYQGLEDVVLGQIMIPAIENRYSASVSLFQPVYTGGRLSGLNHGASLQEMAAASARDGVRADVVMQAIEAYWGWAKAFRALEVLNATVGRMAAHAADVHHMHEAGLVTDNEMLATDVLVDRTSLALEQAQRQVERAQARISFVAGMELVSNSVPERVAEDGDAGVPEESGLLDIALMNRPERAARNQEVNAAKELARAARGAFYPQAYLTARYEQANPNILYIPPVDEWKGDAFVGVSVSLNLLDWGLTRAKAGEADARTAQAQLRLRNQEEQIALEVREVRIALRDARERVKLSEKVLKSAGLNLESATDLWKNGVTRHSEVLDAHSRLTEAQFEAAVARTDVALARAALAHAVGKTVLPADKR